MRTLYVSYTYLDTVEVPNDATDEEIEEYLGEIAPASGYNDLEWGDTDGRWYR